MIYLILSAVSCIGFCMWLNKAMDNECVMDNECNCDGCKISRDPNSGYQPCHKTAPKNATPPGKE
ncbi:hypothetical protein NVP1181O_06 [Vibrio phage 1.181.O._10N.286.46.C9]|nr:hypothetical protein NVP1181O_06 [Vibrio phage 1.181.O._10N.286.46.C9]